MPFATSSDAHLNHSYFSDSTPMTVAMTRTGSGKREVPDHVERAGIDAGELLIDDPLDARRPVAVERSAV